MIKVSLVNLSAANAVQAVSHAAKVCYQNDAPKMGDVIDVEGRLFSTGHHTTFQHVYCTFFIDGISIGDITFGLHVASPFYNSSQRSGRFCGKMFAVPDFGILENYIKTYWPEVNGVLLSRVMKYIKNGIVVYQNNIEKATAVAKDFIKSERPNANGKYLEQNGPKIAQEQLRTFIPVVFPTAFDFTVNLSALAAMYRVAWSPTLMDVTQKMSDLVIEKWPELKFMFGRDPGPKFSSAVRRPEGNSYFRSKPVSKLISSGDFSEYKTPDHNMLHPIDLLHFGTWLMDNNVEEIKTSVEISVATMGQDQRHRTVRRGSPEFSGGFYLPPVPAYMNLQDDALSVFENWRVLYEELPTSLVTILAPYGAMVKYKKSASYNAAIHELSKRLCWCAQEEIYHLAQILREQLKMDGHPIVDVMSPACVLTGKCGEGVRYCGRDLKEININPFPERKI